MPNKVNNKTSSSIMTAKGVTLVEVMIALVVLLVVFMGLLQASLLSVEHNLRNELRDEAVRVASDRLNTLRAAGFGSAATAATAEVLDDTPTTPAGVVTRRFRNIVPDPADPASLGRFVVKRTIVDVPNATGVTDVKNMTIKVAWQYKGEAMTHTLNATLHR
jgi:prepilin-type N-terminal cleavage/methylation domain-containing protein